MQLRDLLTADRAVSPVIGVILMVGIVVTMMAIMGAFVLGVSVTTDVPDSQFRYVADDGTTDGWGNDPDEQLVIEHDGGDDVDIGLVTVEYAGTPTSAIGWLDVSKPPGDQWKPGEEWVLEYNGGAGSFSSDEQVLVLWHSSDGRSTQILADGDLP